jgi:hypothetical protein
MNAIDATGSVSTNFNRRLGCCICGFSEVRTDEVVNRGVLFLAECPRCEHRWTSQEPIAAGSTVSAPLVMARFQQVPAPHSREVQTAA